MCVCVCVCVAVVPQWCSAPSSANETASSLEGGEEGADDDDNIAYSAVVVSAHTHTHTHTYKHAHQMLSCDSEKHFIMSLRKLCSFDMRLPLLRMHSLL